MSAADRLDSIVQAALALVEQGLPCFPCCADKRPATPHGFKDATLDPAVLSEMWKRSPAPLIGVPTGEISGLDVLDIDPPNGGRTWFLEHDDQLLPRSVSSLAHSLPAASVTNWKKGLWPS